MNYLLISNKILHWYSLNKRELPWRSQNNPYKIWVSEIILQQTRVQQGIDYYYRFIEKFPDITALAEASEDDVLKLWQGLGYYSRARNLHKGAAFINSKYNGVFPQQPELLKKIPGIGSYTAAAISSIAFNLPYAVVDGNVYRVLSRYFNIDLPIDTSEGKKVFAELAQQLIDTASPGEYNQAIMDFGALQCKPQNPDCIACPLKLSCGAFLSFTVNQLPIKSKSTRQVIRYFYYLVINHNNALYFNRRENNDIWKNLFEFPLIETNEETAPETLPETEQWQKIFKKHQITVTRISEPVKHILSHRIIFARFIHVNVHENYIPNTNFHKWSKNETLNYPLARITEKYLNAFASYLFI